MHRFLLLSLLLSLLLFLLCQVNLDLVSMKSLQKMVLLAMKPPLQMNLISTSSTSYNKFARTTKPGNKADVEFDNTKLINFICSKLNADTFYNIPLLTPKQTTSIVEKISSNKASGYDGISVRVLAKFCTGICRCVMQISMNSFPNNWKVAKVRPLHKGGARNDKNNYRPISACFNYLSSRRFLKSK